MAKGSERKTIPQLIKVEAYPDKLLPVGIHECDGVGLQENFVEQFKESTTRKAINSGFSRLRRECEDFGIVLRHWVDGSFVTSKSNPGDIDVVHIARATEIDGLSGEHQNFIEEVLNGNKKTKSTHYTDSYFAPEIPAGQPGHKSSQKNIEYWKHFWGHTRPFSPRPGVPPKQVPKGFLEMQTHPIKIQKGQEDQNE